jgi:GNAT superfamily N-acetyltransferase
MRVGFPRDDAERLALLECLFAADPDPAERAKDAQRSADAGDIDLAGLIGAWDDRVAIAAGLFCRMPDASAFVWPPHAVAADRETRQTAAVEILHETIHLMRSQRCPFAQAMVEPDSTEQREALESAGFRKLAVLKYLQRPLDRPISACTDGLCESIAFDDDSRARFEAVLERTYLQTLDCPDFSGLRTAGDAIRSYRSAGDFTPERWRLFEDGGDDVGVVIVNDRPEERSREIVYVGVVSEARRRGIARRAILDVLKEAAADDCDSVLAAVDDANEPAVRLYFELGFVPTFERVVYLWRDDSVDFPGD